MKALYGNFNKDKATERKSKKNRQKKNSTKAQAYGVEWRGKGGGGRERRNGMTEKVTCPGSVRWTRPADKASQVQRWSSEEQFNLW